MTVTCDEMPLNVYPLNETPVVQTYFATALFVETPLDRNPLPFRSTSVVMNPPFNWNPL